MNDDTERLRFDSLRVLITGGASGLGAACVRRFAAEGAQVVIADIKGDGAEALSVQVPKSNALTLDVTDEESWQGAADHLAAGGLDILVNNAGVGDLGSIEEASLASFQRMLRINVDSVFLGCQVMLPLLKESKRGAIINMSSVAGLIAAGNMAGYNASKAAVSHLSKSVALHCAERGYNVTCNAVHPSFVRTPILDALREKHGEGIFAKLAKQIPLGRLGQPEEIAGAVAFLASEDARFMTASDLIVDGGISAR